MTAAGATSVTIDAFGATDIGKVRKDNEDHFVVANIHRSVDLLCGSLSAEALSHRVGASGAYLLVVADGVGGGPDGDLASERTAAAVLSYVGKAAGCFHGLDVEREHDLLGALEETVLDVHEQLHAEAGGPQHQAPATTLTLVLLVWPRAYLVHVGDSRAYVRRRGRVQALTRDQTFGEYMVSAGAWTEEQAAKRSVGVQKLLEGKERLVLRIWCVGRRHQVVNTAKQRSPLSHGPFHGPSTDRNS
jgi:protein phosphatase